MLRYLVRRLLLLVPILLGVSLLVFFWIRALPGGPAESLLGERATPALVAAYRKRYGLDQPVYQQYVTYLKTTFVDRDLGVSVASRRTVFSEIRLRFPATVELTLAAMIFAVSLGIPLGFFAAKRHGGVFDHLTLVGSLNHVTPVGTVLGWMRDAPGLVRFAASILRAQERWAWV